TGEDGALRQSARIEHQEPSAICASRRFMWRVAHLQQFFTRVAQTGWRGAQVRNLYKNSAFSDSRGTVLELSYTFDTSRHWRLKIRPIY
ncbi:hypothetical protein A2U01_0072871, partial [Trifolium medium]|nr:hypothetical protein [Trifolium medium]